MLSLHGDGSRATVTCQLRALPLFQPFLPCSTQDSFLSCPDDSPEVGKKEVGTFTHGFHRIAGNGIKVPFGGPRVWLPS